MTFPLTQLDEDGLTEPTVIARGYFTTTKCINATIIFKKTTKCLTALHFSYNYAALTLAV
jgi:hypothetical protein